MPEDLVDKVLQLKILTLYVGLILLSQQAPEPVEEDTGCSSFRATDIKLQRNKSRILAERGIFVLLCAKHEVPLQCVDMTTGERFDYADRLLANYLSSGYGGSITNFFYDVVCKYYKNLKV
jgi:hypothetical protein